MTGQQLKDHLQKYGIRQYELAEKIGVNQSGISILIRREKMWPKTKDRILSALIDLGHPFEEQKPASTFGTDKTDHTTLVRLTNLQQEVNELRRLVDTQKKIIALLLENK